MDKHPFVLVLGFVFIVLISIFFAIAGGSHGSVVVINSDGSSIVISVFVFCALISFLINWLAYIPAAIAKTERYYDLIGSITFLSMITVAVLFTPNLGWRAIMVSCMVCVWALRLGLFLFRRVCLYGHDSRFDNVKVAPLKFLLTWTLQAFWTMLTAACALVVITGGVDQSLSMITVLGIVCWLFGFTVEVIADQQKHNFRKDPNNKNKFIKTGLWAWSQHPNYFGEIVLWFGMALIAIPILHGWQWLMLVSPLFVYLLLTKGSGIPTLEEKAKLKWGRDSGYQHYIKMTPQLFPLKPKR